MKKPLLSMQNITKRFGDVSVLKGVSLCVDQGEVIAIIGPSGSGKSTLLRCALMLERIDSGSIEICNQKMAEGDPAVYAEKKALKELQRKIGLVFQNFNLFPHLSVLENITAAPIRVAGQGREQAEQKALALLQKVGLTEKASAYPYQLSGGQKQRVAIARAMALEPEILFFDEPTSALDPELTGEILKVIRELAEEKMTMVIVTHEMAFAKSVADRILFLDGGVVAAEGSPEEVLGEGKSARMAQFLQKFEEI